MLDTIIVEIPIGLLAIIDAKKFKPNARQIETFMGYGACVNNPTDEDYKKGIYKPKLTLIKRGRDIFLKIEFSAPKMLWKNNLDEIEEKDFEAMVIGLREKVKEMGALLTLEQIKNAKVVGFHPSKNIVLNDKYTSSFAIRELYKVNVSQKMDIEKACFRNNGEAMQIYAKRHSAVLYDKINDLNKPVRRAIDKDPTLLQKNLFDFIKINRKGLEVLRFEVRLTRSDKMKEVLAEVGFNQAITLENIFNRDLCHKIVKHYWQSLFSDNSFLFNAYNNPQKVLEMTLMKYPKTRIRTASMLVGLNLLCKDEEGFRGFRKIVEGYKHKKDWLALKRYFEKFKDDFFKEPQHGFIKDIEDAIEKFEAFKLGNKG